MLYLSIEKNNIKLLAVRKSIFGQYSVGLYEKKFQVDLIKAGNVSNIDVLASAIKEVLQNTPQAIKDKQTVLILPQEAFRFIRVGVPNNITSSAINSFITDKIRMTYSQNTANLHYDYFTVENGVQKYLNLFLIESDHLTAYREVLRLLDLELHIVLPEALSFFKLFEKTLRKGKIEHIVYGRYEKELISTYTYDSFGLIEENKSESKLSSSKTPEAILKQKATESEKKGRKINRLILSGSLSDSVRQDTFTKDVGMWTNPLKRIIPQFYQDYLNILISTQNVQPFPILDFDVCFGAFIFSLENKTFSMIKQVYQPDIFTGSPTHTSRRSLPTFTFPRFFASKEILLFIASFILSFLLFTLTTKAGFNISLPNIFPEKKISPTPTQKPLPTPTPTPAFTREELKIKVLNGSGTKGKATEVKNILDEKNYQEIVTGNADNFDYETTELQIKKSKKDALNYLIDDIRDYVTDTKISDLNENETADIILIIGADFK